MSDNTGSVERLVPRDVPEKEFNAEQEDPQEEEAKGEEDDVVEIRDGPGDIPDKEFTMEEGSPAPIATAPSARNTKMMDPKMFREQSKLAVPSNVTMFSGSRDDQTSADVSSVSRLRPGAGNMPGGAFTHSFLGFLESHEHTRDVGVEPPSYVEILEGVREKLKGEYSQIPQLSSSRVIDLKEEKFSFFNPMRTDESKVKAVLIGINYNGQQYELEGCINDVLSMEKFLSLHGFKQEDIHVLVDDGKHDAPTAKNIVKAIRDLVKDASPHDSFVFHFAGHGSFKPDNNGDEKDGKDEMILPVDYNKAGFITDDQLLRELILPLPQNCRLTCLVDACHSGTIMDLPYQIIAKGDIRSRTMEENSDFSFAKILQIAKEIPDRIGESLSEFIEGFKNVFPI